MMVVLIVMMLLAGCGFREMRVESLAAAYDVRALHGQTEDQRRADIEACKAKLVSQPGQLEPWERASAGMGIAVEVERTKRYERCLAELGYRADLRPMTGGGSGR